MPASPGTTDASFAREALNTLKPRRMQISGSSRTTMSSSTDRVSSWRPPPPSLGALGAGAVRAPSPLVPIGLERGGKSAGHGKVAPAGASAALSPEESMIMV